MIDILSKIMVNITHYKVVALSAILLMVVALLHCSSVSGSTLEGKEAPAFSLPLFEGGQLDLAEHLGKRPIVLDFWAVWCPPCRDALPKVAAAAGHFKDDDVAIYTVNLRDARANVASFLSDNDIDVPVALDADGAAGKLYQVSSIPTMVFIDREGTVARVVVGAMRESALRSAVEGLL